MWRMVHRSDAEGQPTHCTEPVRWRGRYRLASGKWVAVWSCDGHLEGMIEPLPWP